MSDKPDVDLVIRAMRVGACDFLAMPLIKKNFFEVLDKIFNDITDAKPKKSKCRVISVYSNKGGVGKTSIATNLALELERYKDTSLYVLADPPYFKQVDDILSKNISKLFDILRDTFSYVVVDTSSGFDGKAMTALENSDLVFFVTIVNLPALRNCQRCLELFEKLGFEQDKIQILINRYMENDEINAEDVEEVLGRKIYWKIPNNYFSMMSAINKGIPVSEVNADSNVALSYKNLALMVSDSVFRQKLQG